MLEALGSTDYFIGFCCQRELMPGEKNKAQSFRYLLLKYLNPPRQQEVRSLKAPQSPVEDQYL